MGLLTYYYLFTLNCLNIFISLCFQGYQLHIVCCCPKQTSIGNSIHLFHFCGLFPYLVFIFLIILFFYDKFSFDHSSCLPDLENLLSYLKLCFIFCHDIRSQNVITKIFDLYFLFILRIILVASSTTNYNYYFSKIKQYQ